LDFRATLHPLKRPEQADDQGDGDHRAKNDPHRRVGIPPPTGIRKSINTENMMDTNKSDGQRQAVGRICIGVFAKVAVLESSF